ncbi:5998_t:CDS:2 [Ambispora gerdemannii]|uniref:5998_t:CDS:1 n=1 Tax=Ambispora gerdemannii TaxID=144530 RepID=A0A9N8YJ86_9GLOM|nr:5998_t:CDS:2 [Ambispora gerdemannii]
MKRILSYRKVNVSFDKRTTLDNAFPVNVSFDADRQRVKAPSSSYDPNPANEEVREKLPGVAENGFKNLSSRPPLGHLPMMKLRLFHG